MFLQSSSRLVRVIAALRVRSLHVVLLWLVAPLLVQAAHAQGVSARLQWYGVYTVSDSKSIEDPRSPTGVRVIQTPIAPASNVDRIPGRDDVRFGMSFVLDGLRGQQVTIRRVYRFPGDGMPNASTGAKTMTYEDTPSFNAGDEVLMGWSFIGAPPDRIVFGEWILEAWVGNEMIIGRRFMIYPP
jgi:hypothetical protein